VGAGADAASPDDGWRTTSLMIEQMTIRIAENGHPQIGVAQSRHDVRRPLERVLAAAASKPATTVENRGAEGGVRNGRK
jgi:hypothetical protein